MNRIIQDSRYLLASCSSREVSYYQAFKRFLFSFSVTLLLFGSYLTDKIKFEKEGKGKERENYYLDCGLAGAGRVSSRRSKKAHLTNQVAGRNVISSDYHLSYFGFLAVFVAFLCH